MIGRRSASSFLWTLVSLILIATPAAIPAYAADIKCVRPPASSNLPVIASVSPNSVAPGQVNLTVTGTNFGSNVEVLINGNLMTIISSSSTQIVATGIAPPTPGGFAWINVANLISGTDPKTGQTTIKAVLSTASPLAVSVLNPQVDYVTAFRFLEQATFGPTPAGIAHLQRVGIQQWLSEQMAATPSTFPPPPPKMGGLYYARSMFLYNAMNGPDQLRQRVAFALGQIFVISGLKINLDGMLPWLNMLQQDAFGNFSQLLQDVTLSPSMGHYLDMVNNDKPNPKAGTLPNENYAREVMQLFTIGTVMLNNDGTPQIVAGETVPTYTQTDIQNLARVFTGWTYPTEPGKTPKKHNPPYFVGQMVADESNHDTDPKVVLGETTTDGKKALDDLNWALGLLFNHPNVGPFIALRMIQHLVTSNPSGAYVSRIANVFNDNNNFYNNGTHTRGDLQAVVLAILLDPEARAADDPNAAPNPVITNGGHLREPVLFATGILRALGGYVGEPNPLADVITPMGQDLLRPASVFNYYTPFYRIPDGTLAGPEFQILTPSTAILRVNFVDEILGAHRADLMLNLAPFVALSGNTSTLIQAVDNALTGRRMPSSISASIQTAINASKDADTRARNALYLAASSGFYQVEH
ncbi:MAG TPA: DUF1800 family protein [Candidatus Binataceae bacterium]|nr:DUF1800 family protein [Candidatus Binataceae bacterium]